MTSAEAAIRSINKLIAPVRRAMGSMVLRGLITLVNDGAALQQVQIQLRAMPQPGSGPAGAEMSDDIEVMQHYGFTSVPHAGAEAVMLAVGGVKAHGIVIAVDDRRYRLKGMEAGEVALYDDLGNLVKLGRDTLTINGATTVVVSAPQVQVNSPSVSLGGTGGKGVARIGDSVAGGKIVSGSTQVTSL